MEDCGGAVVGEHIDLYVDWDNDTMYAWGVRYRFVYIIEWGRENDT